ncbi:MAG: hypothetical protein ACUVQR_05880 [Thermogutta sp.]
MGNEFDPYREALVMEQITLWPSDHFGLNSQEQELVETTLHRDPQSAAELNYRKLATGFIRCIAVTPDDVKRILGREVVIPGQKQDIVGHGHG